MARDLRPALKWAAVQSCFDDPLFDEGGTVRLLETVGVPVHGNGASVEKIQLWLREATAHFAFNHWIELKPSAGQQVEQAQRIALAASLLLDAVGSGKAEPSPENIFPFVGPGGLYAAASVRGEDDGAKATIGALQGVWRLKADAEKFAEVAALRHRMNPPKRGRREEAAIKRLVAALAEIYWYTWLESPGAAFDPPGPFLRLVVGVNKALWERRIDRLRTPQALAQVFQRLETTEKIRFGA